MISLLVILLAAVSLVAVIYINKYLTVLDELKYTKAKVIYLEESLDYYTVKISR